MGTLWVIAAGILGASAMLGTIAAIRRLTGIHVDMVRAIGSLWTRDSRDAFWPGLLTHWVAGIGFAALYLLLLGVAPVSSMGALVIMSASVGLVHGTIVGLFLTVEVAEHHPLKAFKQAGFEVVIVYAISHLVYGLTVGLSYALLQAFFVRRGYTPLSSHTLSNLTPLLDAAGFAAAWLPLFGIPLLFLIYLAWRTPRHAAKPR